MSFIDSALNGLITENGDYSISVPAGSMVVAEAAGTYDSATITLGYQSLTGSFMPYSKDGSDISIANGEAYPITATGRGEIVLRVASAGASTSIRYAVTPIIQQTRE